MERAEAIAAGKSAIAQASDQAESDALGVSYDAGKDFGYKNGFADGQAADQGAPAEDLTPFSQADVDREKAAAVEAEKQEMQDLLQPKIDDLSAQVAALKADDDQKTELLAKIAAILQPAQS